MNFSSLQVNYLGHFLMIAHLLPIMQQSGEDCRIVLTSSEALKYGTFELDTIQAKDERVYKRFMYYSKSKLYQASCICFIVTASIIGKHFTIS